MPHSHLEPSKWVWNEFRHLRQTKWVRDALTLIVLNGVSKGIELFGNVHAARCLGPVKFGISASVLAWIVPVTLGCECGFNTVAVRRIATNKTGSQRLIGDVVSFRLFLATLAALLWLIFSLTVVPSPQQLAWGIGAAIVLMKAANLGFVFQGVERLPVQNAITAAGSLLTACAYFLLFSPGMFLGADLVVITVVIMLTVAASWYAYFLLFARLPLGKVRWQSLKSLFGKAWRYWISAIVVYFYSRFQVPLIAALVGDREAGIYRSAEMISDGLGFLLTGVNVLLLPRLVLWNEYGHRALWHRQSKLAIIFLFIGLGPMSLLILKGDWIYQSLLGTEFSEGVLSFRILVVGRLVVFIGQIYAWGLAATERDSQFLVASVLGAVSSVGLNLLLIPIFGIVAAAAVNVISEIVVCTLCYFFQKVFIFQRPNA